MSKYYKSTKAFSEINKLPSFIDTSTDSVLFKLLNIPSVEIENISKDIEETRWNIIPSTSNLYLPAFVYELETSSDSTFDGYIEKSLYEFTFGLPTNYTNPQILDEDFSQIQDISYVSPFYYTNASGDIKVLDEGFLALSTDASWFSQSLISLNTSLDLVDNPALLQTYTQDITSETDEWITLNENNKYTLAHPYVKSSSVKVIAPMITNPITGEYPYELESPNEFTYNGTTNTITIYQDYVINERLIVEYEYAPFEKLYSFTFLQDKHSILTTDSKTNSPFTLPSLMNYEQINKEGYELLIPQNVEESQTYTAENGEQTIYPVLFKREFVSEGTRVKGTANFKRVQKTPNISQLNYAGTTDNDIPYYSRLFPLTLETDSTILNCYDSSKISLENKTIASLEATDYELYYKVSGEGLLVFSAAPWNNAGTLNFYLDYQFQLEVDEYGTSSPIIYAFSSEVERYYTYLPQLQDYSSWEYINSTSEVPGGWVESAISLVRITELSDLVIVQNAYPTSLAWYPFNKYIEEDEFGQALLSLNLQHIETRATSGALLNRWPIPKEHTGKCIRRFKEYFVLLSSTASANYITFYSIHDNALEMKVTLDSSILNPYLFTITDQAELIIIGDGAYKLSPEYKYYTKAESDDDNSFFWFLTPPDGETTIKLTVEHTLDQWGRIIGNERWYNESLKEYLSRLSNIVQAKGNNTLQGAIDGLSACFNLTNYSTIEQTIINTDYPFAIVEETITSTLEGNVEYLDLPTLLLGDYDAVDPEGIIWLRNLTTDSLEDASDFTHTKVDGSSASLSYSRLARADQTETHQYSIRYKSRVGIGGSGFTINSIEYAETDKGRELSSDYGRLNVVNGNNLTFIIIHYYTVDANNQIIDNTSSRNFKYKYTSEFISITPGVDSPAYTIDIVDIQKDNYLEHQEAIESLFNNSDFKFKWNEFTWDKYRWEDGENIQTGIPTYYDAQATQEGTCSASQYLTHKDCVENSEIWTDNYSVFSSGTAADSLELIKLNPTIVLKIGNFYYNNSEFFLYPAEPSFDLLTETNNENILTKEGPTGNSPVTGRQHYESIIVQDDEMGGVSDIDGGCSANYATQADCESHGSCDVAGVITENILEDDCAGTWTAYVWTTPTRNMANVEEGTSFKQQYNYIRPKAYLLRPMSDVSDLQTAVESKPYFSEVVEFLEEYTFDNTGDPYFKLTNNGTEIAVDFPTTDYYDLFYSANTAQEFDTNIEFSEKLLPTNKILAVGNLEAAFTTIEAIPETEAIRADKIPDVFNIHVTLKDNENGYVPDAVIDILDNLDSSSVTLDHRVTNKAGEAIVPIDISTISEDLTLVIQATQEGEADDGSEDVIVEHSLIIKYLA